MRTAATSIIPPEAHGSSGNPQSVDASGLDGLNHRMLVSDCVRAALTDYLTCMGDHKIQNLHRLVLNEVERPLLETVIQHTNGNQTAAARILGISRGTLRKKVSEFGLLSSD
jgi:Fis family transcriptional regulator